MSNFQPVISLVVAVARNGVIGRDGDMPWRLSSDLKRFKRLTMGAPVIMGRRTFESIGKPLPGRLNIVVTRNYDWTGEGVVRVGSLDAAVEFATAYLESAEPDPEDPDAPLADEIFVIGGGEIYAQAIDMADMLHVTHVEAEVDGDTHFPAIDPDAWKAVAEEDCPAGENDSHAMRFVTYERQA
ncbi:dihydrofolate reductase [Oricola thermophila]|uniref:Dihydrofolate reductase n=1 Tax=Oricola thermophila TaxID=2742145 RepID=A0A6N1V959_9HYPH|nr:dihydrofolate reductase [Oricola thermophila]QKV17258.1 dihydrofolate reductase [Oricola thermophila]